MRKQLAMAGELPGNSAVVREANLAFHDYIALASGNHILHQLLEVLGSVIRQEQRLILDASDARRRFHEEHLGILDAIARHSAELADERMRSHLEGVRDIVRKLVPPAGTE